MYFVLVNDGVEVQKNVCYTPITLKVLNEPKERRSKMGCIWLAAFFPPKVRNYQAMFTPLAEQFERLQPGNEGVAVHLPDTNESGTGERRGTKCVATARQRAGREQPNPLSL